LSQKVERGVKFLKENFLPGKCFTDLEDLNGQARQWCFEQNKSVHGSTGKIPMKMLSEENLLPLPDINVRSAYRWQTRKAGKDGFISYNGVLYGLPWEYSGKEISVREVGDALEAWYTGIRIACHRKASVSGTII
jgi:hypothetical protein